MSGPYVDGCPLCADVGGRLVWSGARLRVIHASEADFPGFYRVVWSDHVAEFSGLSPADRALCMDAVAVVEQALVAHLAPAKINLAALGNMVPHLHWHVIARFDWDSRFPSPVWANVQRDVDASRLAEVVSRLPAAESAMIASLNARSF